MRMVTWLMVVCLAIPAFAQSIQHDIQTDAGRELERKRIDLAKARVEQQFEVEDKECKTRFVVTSCVDAAKLKRLRAIDLLKRDESILDAIVRREAAIAQQKRIDENQSDRALTDKAAKQNEAKANAAAKVKERSDKQRERAEKDAAAARVKSPSSHPTATAQEIESKRSAYAQKQADAAERAKRRDDNVREAKRKADERAAEKLKNAQ